MRNPLCSFENAVFAGSFAVMAIGVAEARADSGSVTTATDFDFALDRISAFANSLSELVQAAYRRSPGLVVGLAGGFALPVLALVVGCGRVFRRWHRRRNAAAGALLPATDQRLVASPSGRAWITVPGVPAGSVEIAGELLRIGRTPDNDVMLAGSGVFDSHALIRRTMESEYIIFDVTGARGSGIAVNGRRVKAIALADGDRVTLGTARVTFHRAIEPTAAVRTEPSRLVH